MEAAPSRSRRAGHARAQHVVDNVRRLADAARARGVVVIHVWSSSNPAPGLTLNAPLFEDWSILRRWCALLGRGAGSGLEPVRATSSLKDAHSAWEGSRLETILKATGATC